jgi:fatty acyl-CoA reductase
VQALIHVSSAYVNSNRKGGAEEIVYPAPEDAEKVTDLVASLSDEALNELTPKYVFFITFDIKPINHPKL